MASTLRFLISLFPYGFSIPTIMSYAGKSTNSLSTSDRTLTAQPSLNSIKSDANTLYKDYSNITHSERSDDHKQPLKSSPLGCHILSPPLNESVLMEWDSPDDPTNPFNWSTQYKLLITGVCILLTLNVTFASSAPTAASAQISRQFNVPTETTDLVTTFFLLGYVVGPVFWEPGSELVGRQPIFLSTMTVYTILHFGQALAQNIQTLLICRFFAGFFACAPLSNSSGVIADIWSPVRRGQASIVFTASVFLGPILGPIVTGYLIQNSISWRWVFWIIMIFAAICTLIMLSTLPETYAPILLLQKAKRLRKYDPEGTKNLYTSYERQDWSPMGIINRTLFRPFRMLWMEPILVLITIYSSLIYGLLYALFQALPIIFGEKRGFNIAQDRLVFIGIGIGTTLGALFNVYATSHYPALVVKWKGSPPPEQRLFGAMVGAPCFVIGIFWLGWTGQYASIPWYVPAMGTIFVGISISTIFISFTSYLVDTYLLYSASAFAANTMVRAAATAIVPLFTVQMFEKLGVNWACTLLGCCGLILAPSPFLFYKYGPAIRARSTFAPCHDLEIAKEIEAEAQQKELKV